MRCTRDETTKGLRDLCRRGALFQAVRDITHGFADFQIRGFIRKRWIGATEDDITNIIALAHQGIVAGGRLQRQPSDQPLPQGAIPRIPQ